MYSLGTVYMYGSYYVSYNKTIRNNNNKRKVQTRYSNPVFYEGAAF